MFYYLIKHTQINNVNIPITLIHELSSYRKPNDYIKYIERHYNKSLRNNLKHRKLSHLFNFVNKYGIKNIDVVIINKEDIEHLSKDYIFIGSGQSPLL